MRYALLALALAACGAEKDERPRNLEYVTQAILAPSCGTAECHSTLRQEKGFAFDTVEASRRTFQNDVELSGFVPGDEMRTPTLYLNLTTEQAGKPRMPLTYALPDVDIELVHDWLDLGLPGACTGTRGCLGSYVLACYNPKDLEGAYNLADLELASSKNPGKALRDCADEGLRCVNGDCK